jgi:hypothetical protein
MVTERRGPYDAHDALIELESIYNQLFPSFASEADAGSDPQEGDAVQGTPQASGVASADTISMGNRPAERKGTVSDEEANAIAQRFIQQQEKAGQRVTAKMLSDLCNIAQGRVPDLPAWRAHLAHRRSGLLNPRPKEHRRLTKRMQASLAAKDDDPSVAAASREEIAWRRILEEATPEERARLQDLSQAERAELIQLTADQIADDCAGQLAEEEDSS